MPPFLRDSLHDTTLFMLECGLAWPVGGALDICGVVQCVHNSQRASGLEADVCLLRGKLCLYSIISVPLSIKQFTHHCPRPNAMR